MSIFQKSIINKYLKNLDNEKVNFAFKQFQTFYGNKLRLFDILHLKEENYQEGFLREIFVQSLGYTLRPDLNYNLTTEYKNQTDSKKADGAILLNNSAIGVIELKSAKTFNLDTIKNQAFNYKNNQPDCRYVITSNFHHLRFYIDNSTEYEEFDLFEMANCTDVACNVSAVSAVSDEFKKFYLILSQESVFNDIPLKMKEETKFHEESISDKFYKEYKSFKDQIFENLVKNNPQYDKLTLFKKSQKLLDRFLFVYFGEDCGLCPPNSIQQIIDQWKRLQDDDVKCSLYSRFQKMFEYLDKGHKGKHFEFPGYNGGLFRPDELLDNDKTLIDDKLLLLHCPKLSAYDFNTDIDVNILGHIFERSLNEIEEITAELKGEAIDKAKTKRKKDGVFYTSKYITNYIVENTIGKLCQDKQTELQIAEIEINEIYNKNGKITKQGKELYTKLQDYKNWLLTLKILDPACGSGAFLNSALDFLIKEHHEIDDLISDLTGDKIRMFDTDKNILENNIFGVDINEESVEIAKLSLWLRTAQKDRKLSDLNNNIKCGNSLIDDNEIAGEKAFNWNVQFSEIMQNGGFDVVIGNPPYRIVFETDIKGCLENLYPSFKRNNDLYVAFFEKNLQLVKDKKFLAFITPNTYIRGEYFKELRNLLIKNQIIEIVDFGNKIIFDEANVFTAIINLKKEKQSTGWFMKSDLNNKKGYVKVQTNSFIALNGLFLKLSQYPKFQHFFLIKDIGYNYWTEGRGKSRASGSIGDKVFYTGCKLDFKDIPYLKGSQIYKYYNSLPINYLKHNYKEYLDKNDTFRFTPEILEKVPKIIYRQTSSKLIATIDFNAYHNDKTVHCLITRSEFETGIDLKFVLSILNSKLLNYYYEILTEESGRVFAQVKTIYIKDLPFVLIDKEAQKPFIEKADLMLSLNKELHMQKQYFINTLKEEKHLPKATKTLEDFNELDFEGLKKEIGKQKARFALGQDTNEWREYFNSTKQKVNEIQTQIKQTDK